MQQLGSHWMDFDKTLYLSFFSPRKSVEIVQISLKSDKNNWYFTGDVSTFMTIPRYILLTMRNVLDISCREHQNAHFTFNNFLFFENRAIYENVEKYDAARGVINMARTRCMLDKQGYMHARASTPTRTHTHVCNIYCFSTATMFRERPSLLRYTHTACLF